ncbi:MAG: ABC transporter ATP-binding protein [Candidatus Aureabacteria bacterium]|nr:ABC transporter ATP-binding protein [Candidatus Auribacterota bacterium]
MGGFLNFDNVSKRFGQVQAVDGVTLSIEKGVIFSLLGPSGCGKTTLLRMAAGFEYPDTGRIILDGEDITDLPPNERKVNTIFQNYALFPHLSVRENIAFGLKVAKRPKQYVNEEVERMLALIQMGDQAEKKPEQLSGGQKQRVAIARALILKPQVLLLDEPLAALDLKLRQRMLIELDEIHDEVGITFVYVTHDQTEAMSISDQIAVMNLGKVDQIGTPVEIYESPRSGFVAAFIGDTNFFEGRVSELATFEHSRLRIEGFPDLVCFNDKHIAPGNPVFLSVRPEKIRISRDLPLPDPLENIVPGKVDEVIYLGDQTKYWVRSDDYRIAVTQPHSRFFLDEKPIRWKDNVYISWHADDGFMLENYSEADERLLRVPPDSFGKNWLPGLEPT